MRVLIGGVSEQDLDLFLLEECVSNRRFLTWFLARVSGWPTGLTELVTAARSVDQVNGESDLELTLRSESGDIGRLLVENKLSAGFQPRQLARYRERGRMYVDRGDCARAFVVLVAPEVYSHGAAAEVDGFVSYEDIQTWLAAEEGDNRAAYKLQLLHAALNKSRLGYNPETDQPVTDFWNSYWLEATSCARELAMHQPGPKPAGAGFAWFFPANLPAGLNICHKLGRGFVDLHFPGWGDRVAALSSRIDSILPAEMKIVRAEKSAAVRLSVPVLNTGRPFAEQKDSARAGLDAAKRLFAWADQHRTVIEEAGP